MSDLEQWKEFLSKFEIEFTQDTIPGFNDVSLNLRSGDAKVDGYNGFHAIIEFDDGKFVKIGVWE